MYIYCVQVYAARLFATLMFYCVASWSVTATADGWCRCVVAAGVASWSVTATADGWCRCVVAAVVARQLSGLMAY
jgi:hypothetical protein